MYCLNHPLIIDYQDAEVKPAEAVGDGATEPADDDSSSGVEYMCVLCGTKYDTEKEEDECLYTCGQAQM